MAPDPACEKYYDRSPPVLDPAGYAAWPDSPASAITRFATPKKLTLDVELATV